MKQVAQDVLPGRTFQGLEMTASLAFSLNHPYASMMRSDSIKSGFQ